MINFYTENLAEFGIRELYELKEILTAWQSNGLPNGFSDVGVRPEMNTNSGYVFLVNEEYQTAIMNGDDLELFHSLPYSGLEGFLTDIIEDNDPTLLNIDDIEYVIDQAKFAGINLSSKWHK